MRLIDADNLISVLDILSDKGGDIRYWEQLKLIVADCPTADVQEVRHGRWVQDGTGYHAKCSVCGEIVYRGWYYSFCPNCGAQMDEVSE